MSLRENVADCFRGWNAMLSTLQAIDRELAGCGPDCSPDFLRRGIASARSMAQAGIREAIEGRQSAVTQEKNDAS